MRWKTNKYKLNGSAEDGDGSSDPFANGIPIFINAGGQQGNDQFAPGFANIRVVENKIFFYGDIDEQSVLDLNRILVEVDLKLQNTKNVIGEGYDPIIHLHVNTYGGSIFAAFSTVDTIRTLRSKVYTYVDGSVASAGTLITAVGAKRFVGQHGHLLIHQLSSGVYGKFSEMEDELFNCTKLMKLLKEFYKKNTKLPMKKLDELLQRDIWLEAKECVQFGIADEIL